jgi:hypothetical protein
MSIFGSIDVLFALFVYVDGSLRNHVRKLFKKQVIDNAEITEG